MARSGTSELLQLLTKSYVPFQMFLINTLCVIWINLFWRINPFGVSAQIKGYNLLIIHELIPIQLAFKSTAWSPHMRRKPLMMIHRIVAKLWLSVSFRGWSLWWSIVASFPSLDPSGLLHLLQLIDHLDYFHYLIFFKILSIFHGAWRSEISSYFRHDGPQLNLGFW